MLTQSPRGLRIFPLAADSLDSLRAQSHRLWEFLSSPGSPPDAGEFQIHDLAHFTSVADRANLRERLAVVASSRRDLVERLGGFLRGEDLPGVIHGSRQAGGRPKLAFILSGIGAHWHGMGRELLETQPIFEHVIRDCDRIFSKLAEWSLLDEMTSKPEDSRFDEIEIAACGTFALGVGLCELLRSWGVVPDVVLGHSMGEITGSHIAGILSREDAARVIFYWSRVQNEVTGPGAMLAAALPHPEALRRMSGLEDRVSLAAINSPESVTFSGAPDALREIERQLKNDEIFCRFIPTGGAYHSYQMDEVRDLLTSSLTEIQPRDASIRFDSTVIDPAHEVGRFDASHWWLNLRRTVRLAPVVNQLIDEGFKYFLEIGPHPVTATALGDCLAHRGRRGTILSTLRRHEPQLHALLESMATLYTSGYPLAWDRLYGEDAIQGSAPWELLESEGPEDASARLDLEPVDREEPLNPERLLAMASDERLAALEGYLVQQGAKVLRMRASELDPKLSWLELGLDSLRATELRGQVQQDLGVTLSLIRFLEGINIRDLARDILAGLEERQANVAETDPPLFSEPDLARLSAEEVDSMLAELVRQMPEEAGDLVRALEVAP